MRMLPCTRKHNLIFVTSDVSDFGILPSNSHSGIILLYDDTITAYRVVSALLNLVDTYPSRHAFTGREDLDAWA